MFSSSRLSSENISKNVVNSSSISEDIIKQIASIKERYPEWNNLTPGERLMIIGKHIILPKPITNNNSIIANNNLIITNNILISTNNVSINRNNKSIDTNITNAKEKIQKKLNNIEIGNITEFDLINILRDFDNIVDVWKDTSNSKFDVYYVLKDENVIRGLQVKSISKRKNKQSYLLYNMHKYKNGMLIVGLSKEYQLGLAYINSDKYNNIRTVAVSFAKNPKSEFSKILLRWDNFLIHLKNILSEGQIITTELFKDSMSNTSYLEYLSIERFKVFCEKYGWNMKRNLNNSSETDLFVDGFRVQMKYRSNPRDPANGKYGYTIHLKRTIDVGKYVSYKKGDNDFYVIEIGSHHGDFLIVPEKILIDKGYISINEKPRGEKFDTFPYGYLAYRLANVRPGWEHMVKGNWTMNPLFWFSTEKGRIEETHKLEHITLQNIKNLVDI